MVKTLNVSEKTHTRLMSILRKGETVEDAINAMIYAYTCPSEFKQLDKPLHIRNSLSPKLMPSERLAIVDFLNGRNKR